MKHISSILILVVFNIALVLPQEKRISLNNISILDSLLVQLDTARVREYIQNDSLTTQDYFLSTSCDWDSVKTGYANLLHQLENDSSRIDSLRIIFPVESIRSMNSRFQTKYAGPYAEEAFAKVNTSIKTGNKKETYVFYFIADFVRRNYINTGKLRIINIADQVEAILQKNKAQLDPLAKERGIVEKHILLKRRLQDAGDFIEYYKREDKSAPIFQCVVPTGDADPETMILYQWLDKRFYKYEVEWQRQKNILELEEESKFKDIRYAVGIGGGGLIAFKEFSQPYLAKIPYYVSGFGWITDRINLDKETREVLGYSASIDFAWYIKDDLSLETCFSYSSTKRSQWVYVGGFSKYKFESLSPIQYYSFSLVGNYLLRVKTGMRPLVGAGINYFNAHLSKESTFDYQGGYHCISSPVSTKSMRIVLRFGVEYIPSDKSALSYSVLLDGLFSVISPQKENPTVIIPSFRLSWLF
jgi:opacity protein-like surface antigen